MLIPFLITINELHFHIHDYSSFRHSNRTEKEFHSSHRTEYKLMYNEA